MTTTNDINLRILRSSNRRLKVQAAKLGVTVKDLIDILSRIKVPLEKPTKS